MKKKLYTIYKKHMYNDKCRCKDCIIIHKLEKIEKKLTLSETKTINDLWDKYELAMTDLAVERTKMEAIKRICEGGLVEAMEILDDDNVDFKEIIWKRIKRGK